MGDDLGGLRNWLTRRSWPDVAQLAREADNTIFRHPYGFVVVRFPSSPFDGWAIRLHIWPSKLDFDRHGESRNTIDQRIHSHGWDIWSKVVVGAVEQVQFQSSPSSAETDELLAFGVSSDFGTGYSRLIQTGELVRAAQHSSEIRTASDDAFLIPKAEFHQTYPVLDDRLSATVIAGEIMQDNTSIVLAPRDAPSNIDNRREDVDNLQDMLDELDDLYLEESAGADMWVAFAILENNQQILLVRPHRDPTRWQPVGGQGERDDPEPIATVIREIREEIGQTLGRADLVKLMDLPRDVGTGRMHVWSASVSKDINLQLDELYEARWFDIDDVPALNMLPGTRAAVQEFTRRRQIH